MMLPQTTPNNSQLDKLDFELRIHTLEKLLLSKQQQIHLLDSNLERLSTAHPIDNEDSIIQMLIEVNQTIKGVEQIFTDLKDSFLELQMSFIFDIFRNICYTLVNAVRVLVQGCQTGVERRLLIYRKTDAKPANNETECIEEEQQKLNRQKSSQSDFEHLKKDKFFSEIRTQMEIDRIYNTVLVQKQSVERMTSSHAPQKLQQLKKGMMDMMQKSENILEQAYKSKNMENKLNMTSKICKPEAITSILTRGMNENMKTYFKDAMERALSKIYDNFYANQYNKMKDQILKLKVAQKDYSLQTDHEITASKYKTNFKDKRLIEKLTKDLEDCVKDKQNIFDQYMKAMRHNDRNQKRIEELQRLLKIKNHENQGQSNTFRGDRTSIFNETIQQKKNSLRRSSVVSRRSSIASQENAIISSSVINFGSNPLQAPEITRNDQREKKRTPVRVMKTKFYEETSQEKRELTHQKNDRTSFNDQRGKDYIEEISEQLVTDKISVRRGSLNKGIVKYSSIGSTSSRRRQSEVQNLSNLRESLQINGIQKNEITKFEQKVTMADQLDNKNKRESSNRESLTKTAHIKEKQNKKEQFYEALISMIQATNNQKERFHLNKGASESNIRREGQKKRTVESGDGDMSEQDVQELNKSPSNRSVESHVNRSRQKRFDKRQQTKIKINKPQIDNNGMSVFENLMENEDFLEAIELVVEKMFKKWDKNQKQDIINSQEDKLPQKYCQNHDYQDQDQITHKKNRGKCSEISRAPSDSAESIQNLKARTSKRQNSCEYNLKSTLRNRQSRLSKLNEATILKPQNINSYIRRRTNDKIYRDSLMRTEVDGFAKSRWHNMMANTHNSSSQNCFEKINMFNSTEMNFNSGVNMNKLMNVQSLIKGKNKISCQNGRNIDEILNKYGQSQNLGLREEIKGLMRIKINESASEVNEVKVEGCKTDKIPKITEEIQNKRQKNSTKKPIKQGHYINKVNITAAFG